MLNIFRNLFRGATRVTDDPKEAAAIIHREIVGPDVAILESADDLFRHFTKGAVLKFMPGKYGRVDLFWLTTYTKERGNFKFAELATQPGEETLAVLERLDELVRSDATTCHSPARLRAGQDPYQYDHNLAAWYHGDHKATVSREGDATSATQYRRRIEQQRLILDGKLKRGNRAFGFLPMEGGT